MPEIERASLESMQRLCKQGVRAAVQIADVEGSLSCKFWEATPDAVTLRVTRKGIPATALAAGAAVFCVFEVMGRARSCKSRLIDVVCDPDGHAVAVRVLLPELVSQGDRRRAFRVPIIDEGVVTATLILGARVWHPKVRNLSVIGGLLTLHESVAETLRHDSGYKLRLEALGDVTTVRTSLKRKGSKGRVAVHFPESLQVGDVVPPVKLAKMVRSLELYWLRKRSGIESAA